MVQFEGLGNVSPRCLSQLRALVLMSALLVLGCHTGVLSTPSGSVYNTSAFTVTPKRNGSVLRATVYHPVGAGNFQPVYFIGGIAGVLPAETYSDLLFEIASSGYVVMGIDRFIGPDNTTETSTFGERSSSAITSGPELFAQQMKWLENFITTSGLLTSPDWNATSLMCHSEGCDVMLTILEKNIHGYANVSRAIINLDPFSLTSRLTSAVHFRIPSFNYMSALSEAFPSCCIKGLGYRRFYDLMPCQKVKMNVAGFGHCDLLDLKYWQVCHKMPGCVTTNDTRLSLYRNFLHTEVTSFLAWAVDGDVTARKFFANQSYIPFPLLDFAFDDTPCS